MFLNIYLLIDRRMPVDFSYRKRYVVVEREDEHVAARLRGSHTDCSHRNCLGQSAIWIRSQDDGFTAWRGTNVEETGRWWRYKGICYCIAELSVIFCDVYYQYLNSKNLFRRELLYEILFIIGHVTTKMSHFSYEKSKIVWAMLSFLFILYT